MILRWSATLAIGALLVLAVWLPDTSIGRRGSDPELRSDVPGAVGEVGRRLPDFTLPDLDGTPVTLSDLRGHRVLLTFERSVDW
jgi:cytochrome oxidase Cu insertion factor (SCO1/SenC/PrrC family)